MKHILLLIKLVILFWKHWSRIIRFVIAIHIFDFTTHILIGSSAFHTRRRNIIDIRLNILIFKQMLKVSIVVTTSIGCECGDGHLDLPSMIERRHTFILRKSLLFLKIHIVHY